MTCVRVHRTALPVVLLFVHCTRAFGEGEGEGGGRAPLVCIVCIGILSTEGMI